MLRQLANSICNGQVEDDEERPLYAPERISEVDQRVSICPLGTFAKSPIKGAAGIDLRVEQAATTSGFPPFSASYHTWAAIFKGGLSQYLTKLQTHTRV